MADGLNFLQIGVLWWFLALPALAFLLFLGEKLRAHRSQILGFAKHSKVQLLSILIPCFLTFFLIFSRAQPYNGYQDIEVGKNFRSILLMVDVSKSMLARDLPGSRLISAKRKIFDLLKLTRQSGKATQIGIILFAGEAYLYCPITADYSVLEVFARSISTELVGASGSNLSEALKVLLRKTEEKEITRMSAILLSDGEDDQSGYESSVSQIAAKGIPIHSLGFGSAEGSPIKLDSGQFFRDPNGKTVHTKLSMGPLQQISDRTGGIAQVASLAPIDLERILSNDRQFQGDFRQSSNEKETIRIHNEVGVYCIWFCLLLILVLALASRIRVVLVFPWILIVSTASLLPFELAQADTPYTAKQKYDSGDYEEAEQLFRKSLKESPNPRIAQGLASALYKQGKYKEAAEVFESLIARGSTSEERFESHYNLGNAQLMQDQFEQAIQNYEQALRDYPDDPAARFNLQLAKKQLEAQQQQQQQQDKEQQQQNQDEQQQEQQQEKSENSDSDQNSQQDDSQDQDSEEQQSQDHSESEQDPEPSEEQKQQENQESQEESSAEQSSSEKQNDTDSEVSNPDKPQQHSAEELNKEEARAWLESLPDAPVLLRKKESSNWRPRGQTW